MKYNKELKKLFLGIFEKKVANCRLQLTNFAKYFNIFRFAFFFIILLFTINYANSQTVEETLKFADNQFDIKNYDIALENYKRVLFFEKDKNNFYINNQIADIYAELEDFNNAIKYYDFSINSCTNDSIKFELIFKKASCNIFLLDFQNALIDLYAISDSLSPTLLSRKYFYLGVCFYGLENFKSSEKYFIKSLKNKDNEETIRKLFRNKNKFYRPYPKVAIVLSFVFPGAGQIYSGNFKDGFNSFSLTSALAGLTFYISYRYSPIDAIIILPWFTRYYQGGINNAKKSAERKRQENRNEIFNDILKTINK